MEAIALRPADAAKVLGVSRSLVYELMADGELESFSLGRARLIPADSLRELIERRRQPADRADVARRAQR